MASALNPIGDLYKTQVRQLSRTMNIPAPIIDKPPSADLWAGQTDEGELGFTYEEVDQLLYLLIDQRYLPEECLEAGFDKPFVDKVVARIRRSQFKRMMPIIAKISNRTIGYDFLYLRDWGT
jgi:NAD+ synthase